MCIGISIGKFRDLKTKALLQFCVYSYSTMKIEKLISMAILATLVSSCGTDRPGEGFTRGIGNYPGDVSDFAGPEMKADAGDYRNLAFRRAVHHSSSYDYNLTGQLVADGIVFDQSPACLAVATSDGPVPKRIRECLFDDNWVTAIDAKGGKETFLQLDLRHFPVTCDQVALSGTLDLDPVRKTGYHLLFEASEDGRNWFILGEMKGSGQPGILDSGRGRRTFRFPFAVPKNLPYVSFRFRLDAGCVSNWHFEELDFLRDGKEFSVLPSCNFQSAWMSEGADNEWLYVDFGAKADFDKIVLSWIEKPVSGQIDVSDDGLAWKKLADLPRQDALTETLKLTGTGRYVRLSGLRANASGHVVLSELEVYGKGGLVPVPKPQAGTTDNRLYLSGGNWRLERASRVEADGEQISVPDFPDDTWLTATVPGTVASSYFNVGAIPDIRYDDDQLQISESFFCSDFWYRNTFELPSDFENSPLTLNFDGINWKADVYFNGSFAGHADGAFTRAHLNVTALAKPGLNALAVKIYKNDNPGIVKEQDRLTTDWNGGVLGADNPTMHCTIGWDWIPTVRGRNAGIWNDVYLASYRGGISIDDVYIPSDLPLPDTGYADLHPIVTVTNHTEQEKPVDFLLTMGNLTVKGKALLKAGETRDVDLGVTRMEQPQLWWPTGYGEPYLYDVHAAVSVEGRISDTKDFKTGIREMSYKTDGGILDIFINGRRLVGHGGNWGYPEINLNYRAREYDAVVAYHADMHFTMLRNWVGQTGDEELYEACDKYGVMVWQDFWLANPWDGPDPDDGAMFLANAEDYVRKIRNHPCIALYVGRNEGDPPATIDNALVSLMENLHPGLFYIPNSASGMVSGGGPYRALAPREYFSLEQGKDRIHSERGMPNMMVYESMLRMLRNRNQWPQTSVWGMHDYTLEKAQSAATFNGLVEKAFGEAKDLKQFTEWAQWIDYNGYRAIFESRSSNRKGVLLWMSHSCWPSLVWNTYDYYLEPSAAYFGSKKACAPLHIQWNPASSLVEVVNNSASDQDGLTAYAAIVNADGKVLYEQSAQLSSPEDSTQPVFPLSFDLPELSETYFIKLRLTDGGKLLDDNFYWEGKEEGNLKQLLLLPAVRLDFGCRMKMDADGNWTATATVRNTSDTPALMIRLKVQRSRSGESILPVLYEDNFFSLLPGEKKTVTIRFKNEDTGGEKPQVKLEGFNVKNELK